MKLTTQELVDLLTDMTNRIKVGDSFEGSIEYTCMEEDLGKDEWRVAGCYKIGNSEGQGGMRLLDA